MPDYSALKQTLQSTQKELSDKLERIKADVSKEHSADWKEQAQERENDEVLNQLGAETEKKLRMVNEALDRIKKGTYGTCIDCGCEIPEARLKAKPEAARCIKCAA